jgi:hypothetical protein
MPLRLANVVTRLLPLVAVALLMLVPTGICICAEGDDELPSEQHEPGCPKVRMLDLPAGAQCYAGDPTESGTIATIDSARPDGPSRLVEAVGHGPPRGRPFYLTLGTLLN